MHNEAKRCEIRCAQVGRGQRIMFRLSLLRIDEEEMGSYLSPVSASHFFKTSNCAGSVAVKTIPIPMFGC